VVSTPEWTGTRRGRRRGVLPHELTTAAPVVQTTRDAEVECMNPDPVQHRVPPRPAAAPLPTEPPSPSPLRLTVNGTVREVRSSPTTPLLYILRDELQLQGPRFGCGLGQCGACTVHVGGNPVRSCTLPVSAVAGQTVTTLEGLGSPDRLHPVQQAFIDEQAMQCGYCINGWIMTAVAFLARTPTPTDGEIRAALSGLICRCGAHVRIIRAVKRAAALRQG
jgi:nicotinate dehydrogenase subunit A